jgi:hypothetical protein
VDLAPACEGDEVRLLLAPPSQGRCPFPRPTQLEDLLAGEDHPAVDDSGHDRREAARGDRHHRFVQQAEALPRPAGVDEELPLRLERQCEEVPVAEPLGDLGGCGRGRAGAVDVALGLVLEGDRHQEVALLRTLAFVFDQPLGTAEPARRRPHLSAQRELHADPECAARSRAGLALLGVPLGRSLEDLQLLVFTAEHVGRDRKPHEILGTQRLIIVRARERLVGRRPRRSLVRLPSLFEQRHGNRNVVARGP